MCEMSISLKAARVNRNMSRADASKRLGISEKTLESWENGGALKRRDLMALSMLYGVDVNSFRCEKADA